MTFNDWWKKIPHWAKGSIIGFTISLVLVTSYALIGLFQGANLGTINSALITIPMLLLPITILFGLVGAVLDYFRNKKIIHLAVFLIILTIIIFLWILMYNALRGAYVG